MDGGAWWAAVYGVAQSRTRLKRLSSSSSSFNWAHCYLGQNWGSVDKEEAQGRGSEQHLPRGATCHLSNPVLGDTWVPSKYQCGCSSVMGWSRLPRIIFLKGGDTAPWPFTVKNLWLMLCWLQTAERTIPPRPLWLLNVIKPVGCKGNHRQKSLRAGLSDPSRGPPSVSFMLLRIEVFILRTISLDFEPVFYLSCFSGSLTSPCLLNFSSQLQCMPNLPS